MAIYDVKYNPSGAYIPGATQVGTLAVAIGQVDYSTGGWYGGVDDSLGYVIYSDTSSTNLSGRSAGSASSIAQALKPTFFRSKGKTDSALLELIKRLPGNTQSFANVNDAKAWLNSSGNFGSLDMSSGTASGGGATGSGSWYFYATEGELTVGPPTSDGQVIFTDNLPAGSTDVTFNPNKSGGVNYLNFNLQDSTGVDYTTQFTNLQTNGGTVSVIQNGITATYTLAIGMAFIQNPAGFLVINTAAATQTVTATSNFVYADPISISFS